MFDGIRDHALLDTIEKRCQVPDWVDYLALKWIGVMHAGLFMVGLAVSSLGLGLATGLAPSWSSFIVFLIGAATMGTAATTIHGLRSKRPELLVTSLYGLICIIAWVACIGAVMYTLVAQVDSPVAKYVVCNWDSESEHMKDECSWFQLQEVPNPIDCTDAHLDIGTYERTACQTQRVDYIHSSLSTANSFVTFAFAILLVVAIINRSVRRQFVEKDTQPDPFTKFVICVLSACAFCMSVLLVFFAMRWWNYTYTAVMYVAAGAFTAPVLSLSCYAIILSKKALLPVTNILLPINLAGLFSSAVFGGFFTGNLQTVSEMYHRNYHQIRTDVEKVMPSVCAGMSDAECKARMKVLTLEQLSVAGDFIWCFVLFLLAIIALTWRAVTHFSDSLTSLHGLSRFGLDTIEKVVHLQRDEIVSVADLFWNILHHPHRPMNEVILRQQSDTNGSLAALEVTLRENERKRLWSTPAKALQEECLSLGLDPLGSKHDLRRRLLSAYSSERMQRAADKDNSGEQVSEESKIEESKGHFYVVGEAELRLIPALAFCPFLDRLIDVFGEDKRQGLLHFEEFLNLYSIFSETCPLEEKIKYAWSVYDFLGSGDIRTEEVKAVVTHILGVTQAEMSDSVDEGKAVSSMQPEPEPAPEPEPEPESELDLAARMLGGIEVVSGRPISTPATSEPAQESAGDDLLMELDGLAQFDAEPSADPSTGTALDLLADLDDLDTETSTPDKMRTGSSVDLEPEPESVSTPEANKSQQQQQQQHSVLQRFGSVLPGVDPSQHHIEKQAMRDARERKRREELRKASNEKLQQKRAERRHKARDEVQQLVQLVIDEVDEDGDGVMNFHEFRKALLKSTTFHERFQLPAPNITELLPFPSSEEMDSDDDTTLTDDDKVLMDQFAAGHRRRRKSLEGQPHSIPIDTTSQGRFTNPMHASDQSKTIEASPAALVMSDMFSNLGIKKKRRAPNDDQKRQKMWQHFQEKQEERRKQAAEKHKLGEDLVRPPHLELTENPNRCRSIYSKLVAQYLNDESIKQQQKFDRKRQREDYNHGQALRHRVSGVASAGKSPKATFNSMIGLDWNQVDVNGALVTRSLKNVGKQIIGVFVTVVETFETIQHQDKIPLFRRSVQTIEGEFGAGIASVFSLKRWLLCINAYMALFWTLTIILPSLVINEEEQSQVPQQVPTANAISSDSGVWHITNSSLQEGELPSFAWLYYSTYPARLGTYRLDFWYLATVVLLYCFNMSGVMRNIAWTTKIRFQNSLSDGDRSFAASSLVFGAYDYRASMRKIVAQNQKQTRNHLRTVLMKERAKAERLVGKFKGQLKRGAGLIASVMLASLMGTSIIFVIQNTLWLQKWSPVPNTTNNLITLIKISIPKVVPLIVRREGRKDVSDIMQTVIRRVYLCQMISLGLLFKELLDLQNTASENGMLYRQCIIWVGATVSPAMAVLGMINNYLLFFLSKWELLYLYRPPSNPWGEDDAKALNSKLVFTTLLFSSAPLLAWLARAPVCGPHAGVIVMSTYTNYMETEVSGFIRETVGATSMFLFNGTPLFFLLASASIALYFQTARIDSLQTALKQLKTDVEREHGERVAVVKAVSQLPTESGFILPTAWKRMQEEQAIDGLEGIPHPEHITWEQVNNLVRGNQLNLAQKPSEPSRGNRVIRNPMDGPATASRPAAQPIRNPMLSGAGMPGAPPRPGTGGEQKEEAADLLI